MRKRLRETLDFARYPLFQSRAIDPATNKAHCLPRAGLAEAVAPIPCHLADHGGCELIGLPFALIVYRTGHGSYQETYRYDVEVLMERNVYACLIAR